MHKVRLKCDLATYFRFQNWMSHIQGSELSQSLRPSKHPSDTEQYPNPLEHRTWKNIQTPLLWARRTFHDCDSFTVHDDAGESGMELHTDVIQPIRLLIISLLYISSDIRGETAAVVLPCQLNQNTREGGYKVTYLSVCMCFLPGFKKFALSADTAARGHPSHKAPFAY